MPDIDIVEQLNELLAAERAGVDTLSRLGEHASAATRPLFDEIRDDEAWSCAGLVECLKRLGHQPTRAKGNFAEKVLALPTLPERLRLLNRGQRWVMERIDGLLPKELHDDTRAFLTEMRDVHIRNVARCDELLVALDGAAR